MVPGARAGRRYLGAGRRGMAEANQPPSQGLEGANISIIQGWYPVPAISTNQSRRAK